MTHWTKMNNIDWSAAIPKESIPDRKLWLGVLHQSYMDATNLEWNKKEDKRYKYDALSFFFDDERKEYRNRVCDYAEQDIKSWQTRLEDVLMCKDQDYILDTPHTPDDDPEEYVEPIEDLYERYRQDDIDALNETLKDIGGLK